MARESNCVISFCFRLYLMLDAYGVRFDVMENLENFLVFGWTKQLCYTDTPKKVTYPYPILVGYADTDTRIHYFSRFSFEKMRIRVSNTYCIEYSYPYSCNIAKQGLRTQESTIPFLWFTVAAWCTLWE